MERVRLPKTALRDSCIVFPRLKVRDVGEGDCGLEVVVWLEKDHMERLKQESLFTSFGEWRCT